MPEKLRHPQAPPTLQEQLLQLTAVLITRKRK